MAQVENTKKFFFYLGALAFFLNRRCSSVDIKYATTMAHWKIPKVLLLPRRPILLAFPQPCSRVLLLHFCLSGDFTETYLLQFFVVGSSSGVQTEQNGVFTLKDTRMRLTPRTYVHSLRAIWGRASRI